MGQRHIAAGPTCASGAAGGMPALEGYTSVAAGTADRQNAISEMVVAVQGAIDRQIDRPARTTGSARRSHDRKADIEFIALAAGAAVRPDDGWNKRRSTVARQAAGHRPALSSRPGANGAVTVSTITALPKDLKSGCGVSGFTGGQIGGVGPKDACNKKCRDRSAQYQPMMCKSASRGSGHKRPL
jgi:hypothetical protein